MGFDSHKFTQTKYTPREGSVLVPQLKEFFGDDEKAEWVVRGLTHAEIAKGIEAYEKRKKSAAILEMLASDSSQVQEAIRDVLGTDENVPQDTARRLEHFMIASVNPTADIGLAVNMGKRFPLIFIQITDKIYELTGMGMEAKKKPSNSGAIPISKTA